MQQGFPGDGAGGGGRTRTVSPPLDFESSTSANSITPAFIIFGPPQKALCGNRRAIWRAIPEKCDLFDCQKP